MQKDKIGSGNKGLDWVIVLGMLAAYPKTADLLSHWSPPFLDEIFGMDVSLFYGAFCAALVEGVVLFLHFDRRAHRVGSAQTVKWIMFGVSFACQIFDGFVTTDSVSQMSPELKVVLTYAIPALPLIIAILVSSIGSLPDDDEVVSERKPIEGLKSRLSRLWNGDKNSEFSRTPTIKIGQPKFVPDEPEPEPEPVPSPNGTKAGKSNPTNRQP